ncbi:hypothetical protein [Brevundimonas sp.]|uniref:hypothetical protein n=1 Tax=Brevundimonas sp. TaxID=1871086 RepID=UPI003919756F
MARLHTTKMEAEVDDLLLDLENPRTGKVEGQSEALEAVVRLNTQHFRNMMASIKANDLDPGDSFYIIADEEDEDSFTVVDGNRRLAALKVLYNPDLLDGTNLGDSTKKRLREAAAEFAPVEPISCVLFENRADANEWIERRHGKNLDGEGRISWGTLESDRFQKDRTVLDVIGFVERNSTFEESDWHRIKKSVEKSPTTLRRFLVSKAGKQHLGFVEKQGDDGPAFKRNPEYIIKVLSQIFSDMDAGEVTSRTYNKASEIDEYFTSLPKDFEVGKQVETAAQAFATTNVKDGAKRPRLAAKVTPSKAVKTKKVTPPRATLAPSRHQFAEPTNEKGKQLLREASKLKLRDTPLGCAFLFRAWLEFSIETEMRKSGLSDKDSAGEALDLKGRFSTVCLHLTTTPGRLAKKGDLNAIKTILTAKAGNVSFGALNGYIHNHFQKPSPDDLRNAWDSAIPFFTAIYGAHK